MPDELPYTLGFTGYHADNCTKNLDISPDELGARSGVKVVATSCVSVFDEYLRANQNISEVSRAGSDTVLLYD